MNDLLPFYRKHVTMMRGRARRVVGNDADADDIVQGVFEYLLRSGRIASVMRSDNAASLLFVATTNGAISHLRAKRRRDKLSVPDGSVETASAAFEPNGFLLRKLLAEAPEAEALVASYFLFEDMDQPRIAEVTGIGRRRVGRILKRFLKRAAERVVPELEGQYGHS